MDVVTTTRQYIKHAAKSDLPECPNQGLCKALRSRTCLNQDSQDSRIFKMAIPNPANPFILIILIGVTQLKAFTLTLTLSLALHQKSRLHQKSGEFRLN